MRKPFGWAEQNQNQWRSRQPACPCWKHWDEWRSPPLRTRSVCRPDPSNLENKFSLEYLIPGERTANPPRFGAPGLQRGRLAGDCEPYLTQEIRASRSHSEQALSLLSLVVVAEAALSMYIPCMALVRILVDGYSLLHSWPELARGKARHSEAARDALVSILTDYHDFKDVPVTIFFDGAGGAIGKSKTHRKSAVEVLFSRHGQTADQLIERAAHRFVPYGEVMAVTDDVAERETVVSLGGLACSCENFVREVEHALSSLGEDLHTYNTRERHRFHQSKRRGGGN